MKKIIPLMMICLLLCACATIESSSKKQIKFINYSPINYPSLPKEQPIDLFFQGAPTKAYDVIGEINGFVMKDKNIRPMMEARARQVGGVAIIDIQTSDESMSGPVVFTGNMAIPTAQRITNIKAKVIRYKA